MSNKTVEYVGAFDYQIIMNIVKWKKNNKMVCVRFFNHIKNGKKENEICRLWIKTKEYFDDIQYVIKQIYIDNFILKKSKESI